VQYEILSIYGFQLGYPRGWIVEFKRKCSRNQGEIIFHAPTKNKITISWYDIGEIKKRYKTINDHVDKIMEKIKKSPGVESVEIIKKTELEINRHKAIFVHLKIGSSQSFFFRKRVFFQECWSLHVYCENTGRYFVLYCLTRPNESSTNQESVFSYMRESFKCHLI
jgi:hypothetical protein